MTNSKHSVTRRQTLAGIGLASAAALVPLAGATVAKAADRSEWNRAVARLRGAEAEYARLDALTTAAHEEADAICPRQDEFFTRYGMGCGWSRDRNFRSAHMSLVIERTKGGKRLTDEDAKQLTADAYRVVDDFETWQAKHSESYRAYDVIEPQFDAAVMERDRARDALLNTDAPDLAALLFKIELLSAIMVDADVEDTPRVVAVSTDAKRLLGRA